jgi:hypothetical protein
MGENLYRGVLIRCVCGLARYRGRFRVMGIGLRVIMMRAKLLSSQSKFITRLSAFGKCFVVLATFLWLPDNVN